MLGFDRATIYRMLDDGRLEGFLSGRRKYIFMDSVKKYQEEHRFVADDIDSLEKH
jgi:hypothetical protein